jgi:hypothetical protein
MESYRVLLSVDKDKHLPWTLCTTCNTKQDPLSLGTLIMKCTISSSCQSKRNLDISIQLRFGPLSLLKAMLQCFAFSMAGVQECIEQRANLWMDSGRLLGGEKRTKLRGLSPRANSTDRGTAACRWSHCQLLCIEVVKWLPWRISTAVILRFLDRSRYFFFQVGLQLYSRDWVDPVPDHYFSENLVAPGIELGPLDL